MKRLTKAQDAYGRAFLDYLDGRRVQVVIERDDGYLDTDLPTEQYFNPYEAWADHQKEAMQFMRGPVLDIGAGAGRVSLHLQSQGIEVTALDHSPGAVEACKRQGVRRAVCGTMRDSEKLIARAHTVVLFGNNFGLFNRAARAKRMLKRWAKIMPPGARILAESLDVYETEDAYHLAYHRFNKRRGRAPGELRFRVHYATFKTPFLDWLMVSKQEMEAILDGTGWRVLKYLDSDSPFYIAVLES